MASAFHGMQYIMKRILLFVFLFHHQCGLAQLDFKNSNIGRVMEFTDLDGHSLLRQYDPDVTGSPFINDNWVLAKITLTKGKEIGPLAIKFNVESNELYFLDSAGKVMIAADGLIKRVDCVDYYSKDGIKFVFKNGYPAVDEQNQNYYYQVFTEGKVELLVKKYKYVRVAKDELSGVITKEFVDGAALLYVYAENIIQAFHPTKTFLLSIMKDKVEIVKLFIDANKMNLKSVPDLVKLFNYYNSQ